MSCIWYSFARAAIHIFASEEMIHCPLWFVWTEKTNTMGRGSLGQVELLPLFPLVMATLDVVQRHGYQLLLVAPYWPARKWFSGHSRSANITDGMSSALAASRMCHFLPAARWSHLCVGNFISRFCQCVFPARGRKFIFSEAEQSWTELKWLSQGQLGNSVRRERTRSNHTGSRDLMLPGWAFREYTEVASEFNLVGYFFFTVISECLCDWC